MGGERLRRAARIRRSITKIYGRSDNMVKLRGVNVFPEAIGAIVSQDARTNGEYVCVARSATDGRDEMTVLVEAIDASVGKSGLGSAIWRAASRKRWASRSRSRLLSAASSIG